MPLRWVPKYLQDRSGLALAMLAADGGRRSRRGFAYQDTVTLLDCLDMHQGSYDEIGFEDLDDIICTLADNTVYRQVKTKEDGTRHSIATVCAPERKLRPETSILGRLFTNKPVTDGTRFSLVLNETPYSDLGAFQIERGDTRVAVPGKTCKDIVDRLDGLTLPDGITIEWCVSRFYVLTESRTIEEVEAKLLGLLNEPVAKLLGAPALYAELVDILVRLSVLVERDARARVARRWSSSAFKAKLQDAVTRSTGRRSDGSTEPLPSLSDKLRPVGITTQEAQAQTEAMLRYRRQYRSAIGHEREHFDSLNDHVYAVCTQITAERRAGKFSGPAEAYAATIDAVTRLQPAGLTSVSLPDKFAALSDVTARCQNRYADDS